ncbi:uncharacterized protein LOC123922494 [Trifolium pratense]|uniref:uncharacterized protein LOC123922493 n=1 Tax=Trifolium pratense TaxID=57577 RepID=UPI001E693C8F|nr:uncharacterized protein LOC123922493 [Trifolium pratense]XP_045831166.1 uncharacterized protein LOC123922494 [Trifolium pratense]
MPLEIDLNMPLDIDLNIPFNDFEVVDNTITIASEVIHNTVPNASEINQNIADGTTIVEAQYDPNSEGGDMGNLETEMSDEDTTISEAEHDPNDEGVEEEYTETITTEGQSKKKRVFLSNINRDAISQVLINESHNGKLIRGTVARLALYYSVSQNVIYRIWMQMRQSGDALHKKTKNVGRKRIEIDIEKVRDVELNKRGTYRSLGRALNVNKNRLLQLKKEGILRRHSSPLKPYLKDDNKISRLRFCLSMLDENTILHDPQFKSMYNVIHIDEKWFNMTQKNKKYYLLANEDDPYRTCKNKNYITKVMFLVAMARPRFDDDNNETFSGKIGMWPLVVEEPAIRSSVNRPAGTLVTKPITSITKEVSRNFLINKILPAIKEKWPRDSIRETIYIQQDNAPCHVPINDPLFCRAAAEGGFDIRLICQPPNSPDLNVLDLGLFSAIQSLQQTEVARSVNELIQVVQQAFDNYSSIDSNKVFLTLQASMIVIMKIKGSNQYKTPHMKKDVLINQGKLPCHLKCDLELVQQTCAYLDNVGQGIKSLVFPVCICLAANLWSILILSSYLCCCKGINPSV